MENRMENNLFKLDRAFWIALLEEGKLADALINFEHYRDKLSCIKDNENDNNDEDYSKYEQEIETSERILVEKLSQSASKYIDKKNFSNALMCYKYIFEKFPKDIENIKNYIICLEKLEQFDLQLELAKYLINLSKNGENYKILSNAYEKNQDYYKAIDYYNDALKIENKTVLTSADYNIIGCHYFNSYIKKGQKPDDAANALKYFQEALKGNASSKVYLKNAIVAAMKAKDYTSEKKYWEKYIRSGFASKDDEFTYCASCMRNGDIKEWAKYYGSRFFKTEPTIYPKFDKPEWSGKEDLSNSTLLVYYEQGYGDNFLAFGYMPRLVKIAKHVIYFIQNNAYELVKNNEFGVKVFCQKTTDIRKLKFDYHIPCLSIPIALNLDKENISVGGGYIKANPKLVDKFKLKYFDNNKFKIGIAFEGLPNNKKRDIPFENLLVLDELENVELYCLTKDINDKKLRAFKNHQIINVGKDFNNFSDTAAAIENIDILLSSDNCVLNLAGAMGKKTIGVFNYHYEYRWYDLSGKDSGWYKSVYPIVNNEYNDWSLSLEKAVELIKQSMADKN